MKDNTEFAPLNNDIAQDLADQYNGRLDRADPEEVARAYGASEHTEFYRDINQNDSELWNELTSNLQQQAGINDDIEGVTPVASDGGEGMDLESRATALYDTIRNFVDEHPTASRLGGAGLLLGTIGAGAYGLVGGPGDEDYNTTDTPGDTPTATPEDPSDGTPTPTPGGEDEGLTFDEINRTLAAANLSEEVLVDHYFQGNLSEENTDEVYAVFDDELENGTELSQMITDDEGRIKEKYISDEYRTNDSFMVFDENTSISDILDRDEILQDVENQSQNVSGLQTDILEVEDWYEGEYEEQLAEEVAEDNLNATAENVTVTRNNGNYTVNGTFMTEEGETYQEFNVSEDIVETSKEDFSTVLEGLDTVRTLEANQTGNETANYTDTFMEELENGNFETIQDARTVGQAYEESSLNASSNVTEATVLEGYLENETTARELSHLGQAHQENSTDLVNMTADPLSDDWSGDGADNLALLDLGLDPLENHGVLNEYNITRIETSEDAENNTYRILDGEDLNSTVNSGQLNTFSPAMQSINNEFNNPQDADRAELLDEDMSRTQQMSEVTGFAFEYMDNESHTDTVTDMAQLAVIDERDTGEYGPGLSEKIAYFQTFDEAWADQDEAFQWARLMVDEENLEYADEAGLQLLDPVYSQAMEDGRFSWDNDERLTEDRLEELENEATYWNGNLEEPDIEPDEIEDLDDDGGFSSSSNDGGNDDGGGDDGGGDDGGSDSGGNDGGWGGGPGGS